MDATRLAGKIARGDLKVFRQKLRPGKKDYFVVIGLDVSGSTARGMGSGNRQVIDLIKEAAFAQAELCNRLGVRFAVYAHSGDHGDKGMTLDMYEVKSPDQPWDTKARERLTGLGPAAYNLDGHTMEFYRKVMDSQPETDKVMMYYTDGAMPLENYEEELYILQREIDLCRRVGYTVVGVGIRNDDPKKHGLDTIRVDRIEDLPKLVEGLRSRLIK